MAPNCRGIDRREFLRLAAATPGLAFWSCEEEQSGTAAEVGMRYRPLGDTGLKVSEIAFGAHGVDNPPLMSAAVDAGINTFCTSGQYLDGLEEESLGRAMGKIGAGREELVIITGNRTRQGTSKQAVLDDIDASLRRLRTDYVDVYCTAEVRTPADFRVDALFEAIEVAKQAGKVSHLALSGHSGGMQACLNAAIDDGRFDMFFTKYDFISYPDQDRILERAGQRGIGTIVFKTNAGNRQKEVKDLEAGGLSFQQATWKWALTNPNVASVAVTLTNFDQIRECTAAVGSTLTRPEQGMLRRYRDEMTDKYCRFCGTCEASCPHDVAVAEVMRYAMYFKYYGREKEAMQLYRALPERCSAVTCASCPAPCAAGCPFGRGVHAELVEAHRLLTISGA